MAEMALLGGKRRGFPWLVPTLACPQIRNCFRCPEVSRESSRRGGGMSSSEEVGTSKHTHTDPSEISVQ